MKLNEKLGVPENIEKEAQRIYDLIIESAYDLNKKEVLESTDDSIIILLLKVDVKFKDMDVKDIPVILNIKKIDFQHLKSPELVSLSYGNTYIYEEGENDYLIFKYNKDKSSFYINIVVNDLNYTDDEIKECLINKINSSQITHELMHLYDNFKKVKTYPISLSKYSSYQIDGFPFIISDFLHLLYFMSGFENIVRPSEIYKSLLNNNVNKENFIEFMNNDKNIIKIKQAKNFSLEDFKEKLRNDKGVKEFLHIAGEKGFELTGDNANDILNILFINISNNYLEFSHSMIQDYIDRKLMPFSFILNDEDLNNKIISTANKNMDKLLSYISKYKKNYLKYFEDIEKYLNFVGEKMYKKIFKLYDMLKNDNKNSSIINWDLHTKISSKKESIKYTLNFDQFKTHFKK